MSNSFLYKYSFPAFRGKSALEPSGLNTLVLASVPSTPTKGRGTPSTIAYTAFSSFGTSLSATRFNKNVKTHDRCEISNAQSAKCALGTVQIDILQEVKLVFLPFIQQLL